ncbi:hypothetical protein RB195_025521 [Necator americanus]|uniref:Uncharacterized protein n=1 Tax=Necator americanus TaxID=51031 RepID=A0ABR1ESN7_NECAM
MLNALEGDRQGDGVTVRYTDGPAESSIGYGSRTSSTSLTRLENILDENGEGTKETTSGRDAGARTSSEDGQSKYLSISLIEPDMRLLQSYVHG